jgi:heme-degrading monooxygenase HmoA
MSGIANTPQPPYYAVIFSSQRTEGDRGYGKMAEKMLELALQQKGFLGVESVRERDMGIHGFILGLFRCN